ncbi:MAG: hypothetical protein M1838_004777 [Thelocarpon superellum]|nr:MAG: hypothetical protein M1838_004777 [Thelocarpon superellum]
MAPTESSILTQFLLAPASLPTVLSLSDFKELFPRALRSNPQVTDLYRELQHQRALVVDQVKQHISVEAKRGEKQRREVVRARRKAQREELGLDEHEGREVDMEIELFGPTSNLPFSRPHTLTSFLPELEAACAEIEREIQEMERDADETLVEIKHTIGDLSDLRYGRFGRPSGGPDDVGHDVMEGLQRLQEVCDNV